MNAGQAHQESCGELIRLIHQMDASQRAEILMAVVSFQPAQNLEQSIDIGPLRAAWADAWEHRTKTAVPVAQLRSLMEPPLPIGTVLSFLRLNRSHAEEEIAAALEDIFTHLERRLLQEPPAVQLCLFESAVPLCLANGETLSCSGMNVDNLHKLAEQGEKFTTVLADPPWTYHNHASRAAAANHYPTLSLDAICNEPVAQLVTKDAHLHLWTTNAFLREAFTVIEAWGFEYKSCLVWIKPQLGMGNYWRVSHEFLLLGVRGSLKFTDHTQPSWILAPRTAHSRKPAAIRSMIERVSPGPYLELYGRQSLPHSAWTVYGNQIARGLC